MRATTRTGSASAWLAPTAAAHAVAHHVGSLPHGLGPAGGGTRWADSLDPAHGLAGSLVVAGGTAVLLLVAGIAGLLPER